MKTLHVLFKVAGSEFVLPASSVLHMESFNGATVVPGAPSFVAGLVQVRGKVIPVVDLRARFSLPPAERGLDARVVVVQQDQRSVGLLVDSAREVLQLEESEFRSPPEIVQQEAHGFVKAVTQAGKRLLMLIDFDKVIGREELHGS